MARGAYKAQPDARALGHLIAWAQSPHRQPPRAGAVDLAALAPSVSQALGRMTPAETEALRVKAREFLRALVGENVSMSTTIRPTLKLLKVADRVSIVVDGTPTDAILFLAARLVERAGTERLRICPALDCRRLFLKAGRREFCSTKCQRRVYLQTYDPFAARRRRAIVGRHGKAPR